MKYKTTSVLVTSGIYKYVRHPIYFTFLFFLFSLFLIYQNIVYVIYILYFIVFFINIIIPIEEDTLTKKFQYYPFYKKETFMLIPFIKTDNIKGGYWLLFVILTMVFLAYLSSLFNFSIVPRIFTSFLYILGIILIGSGFVMFFWSALIHWFSSKGGLKKNGIYKFCRNPMYSAIFHIFIGTIILLFDPISIILFPILYGFAFYYVVHVKEPKQKNKWEDKFIIYKKNRFRFI